MNELNRMRKLAGMLTEGVMPASAGGNEIDEMFDEPQESHEDPTMNMQSVSEGSNIDEVVQQKIARATELRDSMVDPEEVSDIIATELEQEGFGPQDILNILDDVASGISGEDDSFDEGGICPACNGSGEGQYDGSSCHACGGSGEERSEHDIDDFDEPDPVYPDDDMYEEVEVTEAYDLNNGYDDVTFMKAGDFFPDGADSPVTAATGASGARQGDNPEQKKMAVAETHKELVYNYRKFLKESAKK